MGGFQTGEKSALKRAEAISRQKGLKIGLRISGA